MLNHNPKRISMKYQLVQRSIDAVQVNAADYNGKDFDESPFSETPIWLTNAIEEGRIVPIQDRGTDYAEWRIDENQRVVPGDYIFTDGVDIFSWTKTMFEKVYEPHKEG